MTAHPSEDLAAFAIGALDEREAERVASHVRACAVCRADVAVHEEVLWELAASDPARPRASLRERVRERGKRRGALTRLWSAVVRPVPALVPATLALLLIVALGGLIQSRAEADAYDRTVAAFASGRVVALTPAEGADVRGAVAIAADGSAVLVMRVPAPPAGKTWQAWVITGDRPVPAGVAPAGGVRTLRLEQVVTAGATIAVTLEDAPGVAAPRGQIVLSGRS